MGMIAGRSRRRPARMAGLAAPALVACVLAAGDTAAVRPGAPAAAAARLPPGRCPSAPGWAPATTEFGTGYTRHAFVGNGYLGQRVPAAGMGYRPAGGKSGWPLFTPRYDGAFVAGLYARDPRVAGGREVYAAVPTWTTLAVGTGGDAYTPATARGRISRYRQTLFLGCGLLRTALTWTGRGGRATDLVYDVIADRADPHAAAVRVTVTPHWTGTVTVTDVIDGAGARRIAARAGARRPDGMTMVVPFRAEGTGVAGAVASALRPGRGVRPSALTAAGPPRGLGDRQSVAFPVRAGASYEVTKFVGVDTALTARRPDAAAIGAARRAAAWGWDRLFDRHAAAWDRLWRSDIVVPGRPDLQVWLRSGLYGLLSSVRRGAADSIAPAGLSSDDYGGLVFWDAEIWMYPSLLLMHPELARSVLDYRYRTLPAARANARRMGYAGAFFPWTSAAGGDLRSECHSWNPPHCRTQIHLQGDIALATWQYHIATDDPRWLRERGWPVLRGIAEYYAGRVTRNADGSYSLRHVTGPDEYGNDVNDDVYTNAVAALALRDATRAARAVGVRAPRRWTTIADRLRLPFDRKAGVYLEHDGYRGGWIKQADATLLIYPLERPMPADTAARTLDYYAPRTDPNGPAMTDSVHAIDAAAAGVPGCSAYTYLIRSARPFVRPPFAQFSEARGAKAGAADPHAGSPAFDFLTGAGGYAQVFTHGLTGLRPRADRLRLDPMLPPELPGGVRLTGLHWRDRTFAIAIGPATTTVTLTAGAPFTVESAQGARLVRAGRPLALHTRRPDLASTPDAARCAAVTASSARPGTPAEAAVDGSGATAWLPEGSHGELTVALPAPVRISRVVPEWTHARPAAYELTTSLDGRHWTRLTPGAPPRPRLARYVRVDLRDAGPGAPAGVRELRVDRAGAR